MATESIKEEQERSVLAALRLMVPERTVQFHEALQVAELQAATLRRLTGMTTGAISEDAVVQLPRLRVVYRRLPTSGMSYWDGTIWTIAINSTEPETRQRFTLLHEFKHIMDHGRADRLYGSQESLAEQRAEQACDYFAGCVLMPKMLMKRAWGEGLQTADALGGWCDSGVWCGVSGGSGRLVVVGGPLRLLWRRPVARS